MSKSLNRRRFIQASALAATVLPGAARAQQNAAPGTPPPGPVPAPKESLPTGRIGEVAYSRLMLGGNLLSGYAHSRDLP